MNAYKHVSKQLACLRKKQQILLKGMLCVLHSVHWAKILKYIFIFTAKRFRKFVLLTLAYQVITSSLNSRE